MGEVRIVAGRWGRRRLKAPKGLTVRPTPERAREAWMSMLGPELAGATVVDLFAGSGALGLEALSRGAAHATFVERSRRAIQCIRENIQALGAGDAAEVIERDVFSYLNGLGADAFDIAVADPPYGRGLAGRLLERYMQVPFARLLSIEHEPGEPLNSPAIARERRYGDTVITFIAAADMEEEGR